MFKFYFITFILFLTIFISAESKCSKNKTRLIHLWHVKDEHRQASIFLFGTIHVAWNEIWPDVHPSIRSAFDASDTVILELALNNPKVTNILAKCRDLPKGVKLEKILGKKLFNKIAKFLDRRRANLTTAVLNHHSIHLGNHAQILLNFHSTIIDWQNKKPVWLLFMLFHLLNIDDKRRNSAPMLDMFLANEAQKYGKNIYSIESPAEQCDPLENIPNKDISFAIDHTLNYLIKNSHKSHLNHHHHSGKMSPIESILEKYKCGELDNSIFETTQFLDVKSENSVIADTIQDQIRHKMFTVRNERMAKRLHEKFQNLKNNTIFVAIGAAHFIGDSNVIEELQRLHPYTIDPIKADDDNDILNQENYINPSESLSFQSRSFKSFRNLWERDNDDENELKPIKIIRHRQPNDFIVWKQEYPPEIFLHSNSNSAFNNCFNHFQLPVILIFSILAKILFRQYFI